MATLTLAQYAQLEKQPLKKGLMLGIAQEGLIPDIMSWRGLGGALSETGVRYDQVISPDWIALDGTIASKSANGKPLAYSVYQMAVHIDVPTLLEDNNSTQLERLSVQQTRLAMKGAAYELNNVFVNGDQASNANQPDGLVKLAGTLGSRQLVGSTEIDLTAAYSDALAESFFARLDLGMHRCDGHKPSFVLANDAALLKMESFGRQYKLHGNHFDWTSYPLQADDPRMKGNTAATRPAFQYRGVPFYDLGFKADQTTQIIAGDTSSNGYNEGGSANATRFICVKANDENVEGLQAAPLDVKNIGLLPDKENYRKRVTWTVGVAIWGPRAMTVIRGVKIA